MSCFFPLCGPSAEPGPVNDESSNLLRVLMVQPELRWQDPAENRRSLRQQITCALSDKSANLVLLPETFTTGFLGDVGREPESMDGVTVEWMKQLANDHDAAIGGSVVIGDSGHRFNRFLFVTPEGTVDHYDKHHLFTHGGEHRNYSAGERRVIVSYSGWRIALQVCYDLRFPVWCRNCDDYELSLFVANWPTKRANAWTSLLQARAIENQAYVIGINRVGEDGNGLEYSGQSAAYDALGQELLCLGGDVAVGCVELDREALLNFRNDLPFLADADPFRLDA